MEHQDLFQHLHFTGLSKQNRKIGGFKFLLEAAGDGDAVTGLHTDLLGCERVDPVDVDDIAAAALEEAVRKQQLVFIQVKGF